MHDRCHLMIAWSNWRKRFRGSSACNIIGLNEVRRKGKGSINLNNTANTVYYSGSDEQRQGVGFVVNKNIAHNVISFRALSDRVAKLTVHINKRYYLKCEGARWSVFIRQLLLLLLLLLHLHISSSDSPKRHSPTLTLCLHNWHYISFFSNAKLQY